MSDPTFQSAWKRGKWLFGGIGFVIASVTATRNAHAITPSMTIRGGAVCIVAWISTEVLVRRHRPEWRLPGSERRIRVTSLSFQPRWFFVGILFVLLLPRFVEFLADIPIFQRQPPAVTVEDKRYPQ